MKKWKIYSIITIILILIIGICLYLFVFKENITEQEAREIAFEYANVSESSVTLLSSYKDIEDRKYEIKFFDENYEYEVDVNYNNGKVYSFEKDIRDDVILNNNSNDNNTENSVSNSDSDNTSNNVTNSTDNTASTTNNNNSNYISEEEAKEIALNHASINDSNDVRFSKIGLDYNHSGAVYEIEFYYNNAEYDYEINALTGEVIKYEKDR